MSRSIKRMKTHLGHIADNSGIIALQCTKYAVRNPAALAPAGELPTCKLCLRKITALEMLEALQGILEALRGEGGQNTNIERARELIYSAIAKFNPPPKEGNSPR